MGSSSKAYKGELGQLDVQNKNTKHYFNSVIMKTLSLSFSIFLALSIFLYLHTLANFGLCLIFIFFSYIGERCIIDFFDVYLKAIGEGHTIGVHCHQRQIRYLNQNDGINTRKVIAEKGWTIWKFYESQCETYMCDSNILQELRNKRL